MMLLPFRLQGNLTHLPPNGFEHPRANEQAHRQDIHSTRPHEGRFVPVKIDDAPNDQLCCGAYKGPGGPCHSVKDGHVLGGRNFRDDGVNIRRPGLMGKERQTHQR